MVELSLLLRPLLLHLLAVINLRMDLSPHFFSYYYLAAINATTAANTADLINAIANTNHLICSHKLFQNELI